MDDVKLIKGTKNITIKVDTNQLQYGVEDIKKLILKDAIQKGYDPKDVSFSTAYKYIEDEWGMNRSQISYLRGAIVELRSL